MTNLDIRITPADVAEKGVSVSFPKDRSIIDSLKSTFPAARWDGDARVWRIPGVRAAKRAAEWVSKIEAERSAEEARREQVRKEAELKAAAVEAERVKVRKEAEAAGLPIPLDGLTGADYLDAARQNGTPVGRWISPTVYGGLIEVRFPYDPTAVAAIKTVPGARWIASGKVWTVPVDQVAALHRIVDRLDAAAESALAAEAAKNKALAARRYVVQAARAPSVGATVRSRSGEAVTVESLGRVYRDEDAGSWGRPDLEDVPLRYVYHRPATPEETAALEKREAEYAAWAAAEKTVSETVTRVHREGEYADAGGKIPDGETIWEDTRNALYGTSTTLVLTADGALWVIDYDGSDGGMWGDYNCGYNTRGRRLVVDDDTIAALRAAIAIVGSRAR